MYFTHENIPRRGSRARPSKGGNVAQLSACFTETPALYQTHTERKTGQRCTDAAPPHRRDNSNHRNGTQAQTATDDAADVGSTSRILPAMPPPTPFPKSAHATASGSARKLTKQKINTDFSLPSETPASSIYSER
ncbi:hypothetical protein TcasGA2_TC033840 [Tribolium castaneum]|uniref:Uncharacterized protein n=1 Tax=Tribolium castaneum TaxID=7070 RepID=A0A139WEX8_TRICA|nr:hypothetical protein TcasGA2_TC033840 [Tribolium castaneum]